MVLHYLQVLAICIALFGVVDSVGFRIDCFFILFTIRARIQPLPPYLPRPIALDPHHDKRGNIFPAKNTNTVPKKTGIRG